MSRTEEDQFYTDRIVEGITAGITSRSRLILFTGVSAAKFTRLAGRAIIAKRIVMRDQADRHGGVVFALYGQQEPATGRESGQSKVAQAERLLRDVLANGPILTAVVDQMARARGLRVGVLKTARANLGIVSVRDGKLGRWKVMLP